MKKKHSITANPGGNLHDLSVKCDCFRKRKVGGNVILRIHSQIKRVHGYQYTSAREFPMNSPLHFSFTFPFWFPHKAWSINNIHLAQVSVLDMSQSGWTALFGDSLPGTLVPRILLSYPHCWTKRTRIVILNPCCLYLFSFLLFLQHIRQERWPHSSSSSSRSNLFLKLIATWGSGGASAFDSVKVRGVREGRENCESSPLLIFFPPPFISFLLYFTTSLLRQIRTYLASDHVCPSYLPCTWL